MPVESESRAERRRVILTLLRRNRVHRQDEIVEHLRTRGLEATQSSVSRDLRDLGIVKVDGRYVAPASIAAHADELAEAAPFLRAVKPAGPHVTVVLTLQGAAQTVGLALDRAAWPEIVGTLAGDDTVFVATAGAHDQTRVLHRIQALIAGAHHA